MKIHPGLSNLYLAEGPFVGNPFRDDMGGPPGRVHDWRNYVPDELRKLWPHLSEETRMVVAICCEHQASNEDWE